MSEAMNLPDAFPAIWWGLRQSNIDFGEMSGTFSRPWPTTSCPARRSCSSVAMRNAQLQCPRQSSAVHFSSSSSSCTLRCLLSISSLRTCRAKVQCKPHNAYYAHLSPLALVFHYPHGDVATLVLHQHGMKPRRNSKPQRLTPM